MAFIEFHPLNVSTVLDCVFDHVRVVRKAWRRVSKSWRDVINERGLRIRYSHTRLDPAPDTILPFAQQQRLDLNLPDMLPALRKMPSSVRIDYLDWVYDKTKQSLFWYDLTVEERLRVTSITLAPTCVISPEQCSLVLSAVDTVKFLSNRDHDTDYAAVAAFATKCPNVTTLVLLGQRYDGVPFTDLLVDPFPRVHTLQLHDTICDVLSLEYAQVFDGIKRIEFTRCTVDLPRLLRVFVGVTVLSFNDITRLVSNCTWSPADFARIQRVEFPGVLMQSILVWRMLPVTVRIETPNAWHPEFHELCTRLRAQCKELGKVYSYGTAADLFGDLPEQYFPTTR